MPILYSNKKNTQLNMKQLIEMTQLEATDWIRIKNKPAMDGYTIPEANKLTELVKTFIDPNQRSCAHCGTTGNLREAKDKFVRYFIDNEQVITQIADNTYVIEEPLTSLDVAIIASNVSNVSNYIDNDPNTYVIDNDKVNKAIELPKINKKNKRSK